MKTTKTASSYFRYNIEAICAFEAVETGVEMNRRDLSIMMKYRDLELGD